MNRSIFQILKPRNYKINFWQNLIFSIILGVYFLKLNVLVCEPDQLVKIIINNTPIRYTPTIEIRALHNYLDLFQNHINSNSNQHLRFNIFKYKMFDGSCFPKRHPFNHYHFNLDVPGIFNIHYGLQLTHKPLADFKEFSDFNLFGAERSQFISTDLRIYDIRFLKIDQDNNNIDNFKEFLLKYNNDILTQFKNFK